MIGTISIPAAHVRAPIYANPAKTSLGAVHYPGTCWPWDGCTVALAGHDVTFVRSAEGGHVFNRLAVGYKANHKRWIGKRIYIVSKKHHHAYIYKIRKQVQAYATPAAAKRFLRNRGRGWLILTTCYPPYSATKRLITIARLIKTVRVG